MTAQRFLPDLKNWFASAPPEEDLPQRVRDSIRANQDQSGEESDHGSLSRQDS